MANADAMAFFDDPFAIRRRRIGSHPPWPGARGGECYELPRRPSERQVQRRPLVRRWSELLRQGQIPMARLAGPHVTISVFIPGACHVHYMHACAMHEPTCARPVLLAGSAASSRPYASQRCTLLSCLRLTLSPRSKPLCAVLGRVGASGDAFILMRSGGLPLCATLGGSAQAVLCLGLARSRHLGTCCSF